MKIPANIPATKIQRAKERAAFLQKRVFIFSRGFTVSSRLAPALLTKLYVCMSN